MKYYLLFLILTFLIPGYSLNAQGKGNSKELSRELLGTYEGHQPKYAMRNKDGGELVIGGNKVWVPACDYKFELKSKNKVTMSQLSEEKTKPYLYTGTYTIIKDDAEKIEILCKVSLDKYTNPEYSLVIDKKEKSAICYGSNEPPFALIKKK